MSDGRATSPTYADVTRDVARTLEPPGNLYFSWMSVVALILTACQQTCPTRAITFGNLKDEPSTVAKLVRSPRAYHVLEEVGTRPSVTYLKKVVREHA